MQKLQVDRLIVMINDDRAASAHLTWGSFYHVCACAQSSRQCSREYLTCTMTTTSTIPVGEILASAFSEILGSPVVTYDEYQQRKEESPRAQFQSISTRSFVSSMIGVYTAEEERELKAGGGKVSGLSHEVENLSLDEMSVCVKTLNG